MNHYTRVKNMIKTLSEDLSMTKMLIEELRKDGYEVEEIFDTVIVKLPSKEIEK